MKKVKYGRRERIDFSRIPGIMEMPDLIEFQRKSYEIFLQKGVLADQRQDTGLQSVFSSVFPIWDFNEVSSLEFVSYTLLDPKYNVRECQERGMTYSVPMKVTLRLVIREEDQETGMKKVRDIREQEVFFCDFPAAPFPRRDVRRGRRQAFRFGKENVHDERDSLPRIVAGVRV